MVNDKEEKNICSETELFLKPLSTNRLENQIGSVVFYSSLTCFITKLS